MKWKPTAKVTRDPSIPWFVRVKTPYNKSFVEALRNLQFPGCQWLANEKVYVWPIECVDILINLLREHNFDVQTKLEPGPETPRAVPPSLRLS